MQLIKMILFSALFLTFYFFWLGLFRVPSAQSAKNLKLQTVRKQTLPEHFLRVIVTPLMKPVSLFIKLSPENEASMTQMLQRGGLNLTPSEYYARAIVCSALSLLLSPMMAIAGLGILVPVTMVLSVVIFFHFITDIKDVLKMKREQIELALPGFIRSVVYKLDITGREDEGAVVQADIISIFEDYLRVASDVFRYDIAVLITEMKSMDIQSALRSFADRVGLAEVNYLVSALIGLERGEQQRNALSSLAKDMNIKARENIRKQLAKRPGKVRMASIPLVVIAMGALLYVVVTHLFMSMGGLM